MGRKAGPLGMKVSFKMDGAIIYRGIATASRLESNLRKQSQDPKLTLRIPKKLTAKSRRSSVDLSSSKAADDQFVVDDEMSEDVASGIEEESDMPYDEDGYIVEDFESD